MGIDSAGPAGLTVNSALAALLPRRLVQIADIIVDGQTYIAFVPTISNINSPTATEILAGTVLHNTLTAGGLEGFEASTGEVDNTSYGSRFDTRLPGVSSYSGTRLILKKQTATDTVHTTLTTFGTTGYIAVRDGIANTTAPVAAQAGWNIYPITTGDWDYMARERNSVLRYWVATPISLAPVKNKTLA